MALYEQSDENGIYYKICLMVRKSIHLFAVMCVCIGKWCKIGVKLV